MVPLMIFLIQHIACCAKHGLQRHTVVRVTAW